MEKDSLSSSPAGFDRREFLRFVGVGSAALGLAANSADAGQASPATQREEEIVAYYPGARYFTGPWRLRLDEGNQGKRHEWFRQEPSESVLKPYEARVPACWQEFVPGLAGGIGWYFKEFELPADLMDRVLRLKFWAVDYFTEVWVNSEKVGEHEGGYSPFELDITQVAKVKARNQLVVRVVDPPRPFNQRLMGLPGWENTTDGVVDDYKFNEISTGHQSWQEGFNFGGIWQPVELLATDHVYISDVFIEPKWKDGTIEAHVEVASHEAIPVEGNLKVVVKPWKEPGKVVGQSQQSQRLSPGAKQGMDIHVDLRDPHAWSPDDPYLYVAEVTVEAGGRVRHQTTARFGLREFTVNDGFFHLNGKRVMVKSGHHQGTYPRTLELPPSREFAYQEVRIFKEAGFNFCRLWVKPTPAPFLDAADELGLMLQEEPALSLMEDSPEMLQRSLREVREMVLRDRNRPSIVLWNMINENDPPVRYVRQQCRAVRMIDPTRLITESAGGPSRYYLPYSSQGISYLTEHPYPGAPLADDIYDYQQTRGVPGQLCFFSEYGFGGMDDLDSVLAKYGPNPKQYMEDYVGHVMLKSRREKVWAESKLLQQTFGDITSWREACQTAQADAVRLHTEAMRANPACGGYNYVQVFDSNAIEMDGLVDFWRDKKKKSFYTMQGANQPLLLVIRMSPMNGRIGEEVRVKVTLVNEEQIAGRKRLRVGIKSLEGSEIYAKEVEVEAKPWVSVVFEEGVQAKGAAGRCVVEAVLSDSGKEVVKKQEYFTLFDPAGLSWPTRAVNVWDVEGKIEPYLEQRAIAYEKWTGNTARPATIVVTPFSGLWKNPEEFRRFIRLFDWVERGCTAIFLGIPSNGNSLVTAADIDSVNMLGPLSITGLFPFHRVEQAQESWTGLRIYAYAWGLTDANVGAPIPRHAVFEGVPQTGLMGRDYGNVAPVSKITTDWQTEHETGDTVQIYQVGRGSLILTSLNLLPNLLRDALAEKLLSDLLNFAAKALPAELAPENAETAECQEFEQQGYEDCLTKYISRNAS